MKLAIILGTRPEIIKMGPVIRECQKRGVDYFILHSGQHYSENMDKVFFEEMELPPPKYNLGVGIHPYRKQIGRMIKEICDILIKERVDIVIVEGDTNTVLAGALAANKIGVKLAHHESGLRSHDLRMLEEINRITTDHISDYLFAPTKDALKNLHEEGLPGYKIFHSGNTIVDAIHQNLEIANKKVNVLKDFNLEEKNFILVTAHRAENVDDPKTLKEIVEGLSLVQGYFGIPMIYPIHPRTRKRMNEFGISFPENINFVEPMGFLEFLQLESNAKLILTDSGGVQEEACTLKVPCVTMRESTERPETVKQGVNIVSGTDSHKILESAKEVIGGDKNWENPFGDGRAAERIIKRLSEIFKDEKKNP
ncbi:MAG: UDP-N-acetylglucosamine 2-epimerase (non-hydrolyzing) [Patescibacteria group bacterium]|nr:UDP-N-acetylglucosamine 2-epimerase (non-hydrolyzing) [Patescibacteria group bacterium]